VNKETINTLHGESSSMALEELLKENLSLLDVLNDKWMKTRHCKTGGLQNKTCSVFFSVGAYPLMTAGRCI